MRRIGRFACILATVALVVMSAASCRKKPPAAAPAPPPPPPPVVTPAPPPPPPPPKPAPAPPKPAPLTEEQIFARKTLAELNAEGVLGTVYFDFDKSDIREDARPILQKNAEYLLKWTSTRITVEGHCDSRGTAEYNLALGERRANAVKAYLVSLGVAADRILAVTKGKEQPVCTEENEDCWQRNRRGFFIFTAK